MGVSTVSARSLGEGLSKVSGGSLCSLSKVRQEFLQCDQSLAEFLCSVNKVFATNIYLDFV